MKKIDRDGNGAIDYNEFLRQYGLTICGEGYAGYLDASGAGTSLNGLRSEQVIKQPRCEPVSANRARELLAEKIAANSEKVSAAFLRFDKDRSGRLTPGEMRRALAQFHIVMADDQFDALVRGISALDAGGPEDEISYADFLKAFATFRPNHVPVPWGATRVPAELAHEYVDGSVGAMFERAEAASGGEADEWGERGMPRAAGGDHGKSFSGAAAHALAAVDPEDAARRAAAEAERARAPQRAKLPPRPTTAPASGRRDDGTAWNLSRRSDLHADIGFAARAADAAELGLADAWDAAARPGTPGGSTPRALGGGVAQVKARRRMEEALAARDAAREAYLAASEAGRTVHGTQRPLSARTTRSSELRSAALARSAHDKRAARAARAMANSARGALFNLQVDAPPRLEASGGPAPAAPASAPTPVPSTAAEPSPDRRRFAAKPARVATPTQAASPAPTMPTKSPIRTSGYCPTTGARLSKPKPQKTDVPKTAEKYARPYADRVW